MFRYPNSGCSTVRQESGRCPDCGRQMASGSEETRTATSFQASARLVAILGEHLITDHVVGLLELVKNGHDADAAHVNLELLHLKTPERAVIVVQDDGFGMSAEDVQFRFLMPATDAKEQQKRQKLRTPKGRLPLGEKGVGRFASQALAHHLELVTRAAGHPEVVLNVNWDDFLDASKGLHDVRLEIIERPPQVFTGHSTGTRLVLTRLRKRWGHHEVDKLHRGLRRLKSPGTAFKLTDFDVALRCPDYEKFQDLNPIDLTTRSHYDFLGYVDEEGRIEYTYTCRHPAAGLRHYSYSSQVPQQLSLDLEWDDQHLERCGPFYISLYVFDRDARYLYDEGVRHGSEFNGKDLTNLCGISIYKDDLRVLPYGERGNDWLQLDQKRINNPSGRIGNKQVIGLVEVCQSQNPLLREKTDREGLQENAAFQMLKRLTEQAIDVFHEHWRQDRPKHGQTGDHPLLEHWPGVIELVREEADPPKGGRRTSGKVSPGTKPASGREDDDELDFPDTGEDVPPPPRTTIRPPSASEVEAARSEALMALISAAGREIRHRVDAAQSSLTRLRKNPMDSHARSEIGTCLEEIDHGAALLEELGQAAPSDLGAAIARLAGLLSQELEEQGIEIEPGGDSFQTNHTFEDLLVVLHLVLKDAMKDLTRNGTTDRRISLDLNAEARRLLVCWSGSEPAPPESLAGSRIAQALLTRSDGVLTSDPEVRTVELCFRGGLSWE